LIIDYGNDHAHTDSFRVSLLYTQGIIEHRLIKDPNEVLQYLGDIDLSSYVNFKAIKQVAETQKTSR